MHARSKKHPALGERVDAWRVDRVVSVAAPIPSFIASTKLQTILGRAADALAETQRARINVSASSTLLHRKDLRRGETLRSVAGPAVGEPACGTASVAGVEPVRQA
jgi:hypothetical protein